VLSKDLKGLIIKGPLTVLSVMAFTTMMNPFSYLVPTIFKLVQIENQNAFNDLDKEKIQNKVCPIIVDMPNLDMDERTSFVSGLISRVGDLSERTDRTIQRVKSWTDRSAEPPKLRGPTTCKEIVYKWPSIYEYKNEKGEMVRKGDGHSVFITMCHRFEEIDYSWHQLQLFVRFTNNRLTRKDAELLGIPETKRTMTRQLTMHDLETTGLKIGSIQFNRELLRQIDIQDKARSKQFRDDFMIKKKISAPDATVEAHTLIAPLVQGGKDGVTDEDVEKQFDVLKFDQAITRIEEAVSRVVIFSQFKEVLDKFQLYANQKGKANFTFFDKDGKHTFNHEARENKDGTNRFIISLSAEEADGYDGLQDVDTMIILEPCTTDSMKRQLIARVVRQGAHSESRRVRVFEYMCTPGFGNIKRVGASMMDWWQHDARVAYWVFEPLLDNTRTPDQVVARSQEVSGEMENLCSGIADGEKVEKGVHNKLKKAWKKDGRAKIREALYGKYNLDILKNERAELKTKISDRNDLVSRLQFKRTTAILESQLEKLKKENAEDPVIKDIQNELEVSIE
jgi:hypothetical protein